MRLQRTSSVDFFLLLSSACRSKRKRKSRTSISLKGKIERKAWSAARYTLAMTMLRKSTDMTRLVTRVSSLELLVTFIAKRLREMRPQGRPVVKLAIR